LFKHLANEGITQKYEDLESGKKENKPICYSDLNVIKMSSSRLVLQRLSLVLDVILYQKQALGSA
jgi:hypothetical protein